MPGQTVLARKPARPARGTPIETRARLVAAAAAVFNRDGYHGTDSNRIARAAGYAPGTFYKHFADKRAILLAAYEEWVTAEWAAVERELRTGGSTVAVAHRIVDLVLNVHRRWRGLRSSLLSMVATDRTVRLFYRGQRRRQLRMLRQLRAATRGPTRTVAEDAVLLFTLERTCDAVANDELRGLGLGVTPTVHVLRDIIHRHIASAPRARQPGT
jgi:AcrR family transcriptional regulator